MPIRRVQRTRGQPSLVRTRKSHDDDEIKIRYADSRVHERAGALSATGSARRLTRCPWKEQHVFVPADTIRIISATSRDCCICASTAMMNHQRTSSSCVSPNEKLLATWSNGEAEILCNGNTHTHKMVSCLRHEGIHMLPTACLYSPMRALASLITDAHSSLSTASCRRLLTFISHTSSSVYYNHLKSWWWWWWSSSSYYYYYSPSFPSSLLSNVSLHDQFFLLVLSIPVS
jgi:hypothetical protein